MTETAHDRIRAANELDGSPEASNDLYDRWVANYDADLLGEGYVAAHMCALLVAQAARDAGREDADVLDVGCGTGLVGIELAHLLPSAKVVGADLSTQMAEAAGRTDAYTHAVGGVDLNEPLPSSLGGPFDVVVCCGTLVHGHVKPIGVSHLLDMVAPGGALVFSARKYSSRQDDYPAVVADLVARGVVTENTTLSNAPYINEESGDYWTLRRP